jgi:hypothetical protein
MKIHLAQWAVILQIVVFIRFCSLVGGEEEAFESGSSEEEGEPSLYFYLADPSSPIKEEPVPEGENAAAEERPDFIYNPNAGHRLVEFYAHW